MPDDWGTKAAMDGILKFYNWMLEISKGALDTRGGEIDWAGDGFGRRLPGHDPRRRRVEEPSGRSEFACNALDRIRLDARDGSDPRRCVDCEQIH